MKKLLTVGPGTAAHRSTYLGKRALVITNSHAVLAAPRGNRGEGHRRFRFSDDSPLLHPSVGLNASLTW